MSTPKYIKEYKFDDEELSQLLEEKNSSIKKSRKISNKIEAYQNLLNQEGHKVQQLKDKIIPLFNEKIKPQVELGEYDDIQTVEKRRGKIVVSVVDRVGEFKEWFKKKQEEKKSNQDENEVEQ